MTWTHTGYAQQVQFGAARAARLRPLLKDSGSRRTMVITSPSVAASSVIEGLGRSVVVTFDRAQPHVPVPTVRAAVDAARSGSIDTIVSIGGGSVIDLAKAVLFFLEQEGGTPGVTFADRPLFVHVAVPTTLAGAEGVPTFAMTDPAARHKQQATSPTLVPRWVVYDTDLIARTPGPVIAASGMTALSHAFDAVLDPATPEAAAVGGAALGRLWGSLGELTVDVAAREAAVEGAALATRAVANAGPSLVQALALLLGGRCGVDHGNAVAAVLAEVLRFNADALGERWDQVRAVLGGGDPADAVDELRSRLGLTRGLQALGVGDDDIAAVARLVQQHPAWRTNPRPMGEADVVGLLEAVS